MQGELSGAEEGRKIELLFGSWSATQPPVLAPPPVRMTPNPGVFLGVKKDVTQTFFSIGHLGGTLRDPDYPALEVAANILGEGFSSRLISRIRTQLGYAYSVGASWSANYNNPGTFRIGVGMNSTTTVSTVHA